MGRVIVGVDPHKKSVTIEAVEEHGQVLATGRFATESSGNRLMLKYARDQWPHRWWAVEGAQGVGRPLAQRLVAQGESVVDVPAKLAARVPVFDRQCPQDRRHRRARGRDGGTEDGVA